MRVGRLDSKKRLFVRINQDCLVIFSKSCQGHSQSIMKKVLNFKYSHAVGSFGCECITLNYPVSLSRSSVHTRDLNKKKHNNPMMFVCIAGNKMLV